MHASPNKLGLPSNGWAFDHWEVKGASGQYFVLGVTSDTLTQFMNWYTGPQDWTNVPDGQTTHSVKAVFVPEHSLQLLEPNLSPITDNHYSFDANTPGVCAVSSIASQDDIPCAGYQWTLDEIDGSELSWSPSPPDVYNPVATFTGLPCENNQFGLKLLTVSRADGSELQEQLVEIFFNEVAKNHPEIPDNEVRNMIATDYGGKYDVPNWFYYWRQTSACYGADHLLAEHSRTVWNYPDRPNQWCARVGADANGGYVFHLNAYAPRLDEEYTWCSLGIDTYAFALRHESNHVVLFSLWWPIGVYNVPGYSPFDAYFKLHSPDYDYIPTDVEAGLGYDLEVPDSNHDGQYDEEDYITRTQALWILGAAGIEDWSDTGQQSHY